MANIKLEVGDTVKAVNECYYGITNSYYHWVGRITKVDESRGLFDAVTVSIGDNPYKTRKGDVFNNLENKDSLFTIIGTKAISTPKKDNTILCAKRRGNRIFIEYRGKVIASSGCDEHDKFDEEFGLNLALRRACNKLKDTHEITDIESVEDYL